MAVGAKRVAPHGEGGLVAGVVVIQQQRADGLASHALQLYDGRAVRSGSVGRLTSLQVS
jgi:hypothetical protein